MSIQSTSAFEYAGQIHLLVVKLHQIILIAVIVPTMNREDDTPHDMREWAAAHS
jgi:hypothetical protein